MDGNEPSKPTKVIAGPSSDLASFNLIPIKEQNREKTASPFVASSRRARAAKTSKANERDSKNPVKKRRGEARENVVVKNGRDGAKHQGHGAKAMPSAGPRVT